MTFSFLHEVSFKNVNYLKNKKMKAEEVKKFGNVTFSETGISYEIPYKDPNWNDIPRSDYPVLDNLKRLVEGRLQNCINHLNENISSNLGCSKAGYVYFKDGSHFSRQAAETMQKILACNDLQCFTKSMFMQAFKACVNPKIVKDNEVVSAPMKENELALIVDVLAEYQVYFDTVQELAWTRNRLEFFEDSLKHEVPVHQIEQAIREASGEDSY